MPVIDAHVFLRDIWRQLPCTQCSLIAQRLLNRRLDGIALRTVQGETIVEVQPASSHGNFFRDGSTPWQWIFAMDGTIHSSPDGVELPKTVQLALRAAFDRLPAVCCVEWVLDADDGSVYFVDAKRVGQNFLETVDGAIPSGDCVPVWCGRAEGVVLDASVDSGNTAETCHLVVAERATISVLSLLNARTRGVVFRRGGLLSHAVVYASQLKIPIVVCSEPISLGELQGKWAKLVVEPRQHLLTHSHRDG